MTKNNTFKNLQVLQKARTDLMKLLKSDYASRVTPFIKLIQKIMKLKELNEFEAAKFIQDENLLKDERSALFLGAALMEIAEETRLEELKK